MLHIAPGCVGGGEWRGREWPMITDRTLGRKSLAPNFCLCFLLSIQSMQSVSLYFLFTLESLSQWSSTSFHEDQYCIDAFKGKCSGEHHTAQVTAGGSQRGSGHKLASWKPALCILVSNPHIDELMFFSSRMTNEDTMIRKNKGSWLELAKCCPFIASSLLILQWP